MLFTVVIAWQANPDARLIGAAASTAISSAPAARLVWGVGSSVLKVTRVLPTTGGAIFGATGRRSKIAILDPCSMTKRPTHGVRLVPAMTAIAERRVEKDSGLQFRAAMASDLPMCVADAHSSDQGLVWVNPAFERVTGYRSADIIGINCRFLQGSSPDRVVTRRIRHALAEARTADETLLNYRADGSPFWNHVVISPMRDHTGDLTHFVGVQADVTDRIDAEDGRRAALDAASRANARLRSLAAIDRQMDARLRVGQNVFDSLPRIVASELAGWVIIAGVDAQHRIAPVMAHHESPRRARCADEVAAAVQAAAEGRSDSAWSDVLERLQRQEPVVASLTPQQVANSPDIPVGAFRPGRGITIVGVPLLSRGILIGVFAVVRDGEQSFDGEDIAEVGDVGVRISMALDIGRLYAAEHTAAVILQQSLLPQVPEVAGFDIAALYQPAERSASIGGDWYDVLDLPEPGIGVAIGDVMGHDIAAAAAMGQVRAALRAYAWSEHSPADVLRRLDELVRGLGLAAHATCFYATIVPSGSRQPRYTLTYTSAGHLPAMLRRKDGSVERLDAALTSPIGVRGGTTPVKERRTDMTVGDVLILYTDGLVESRRREVDDGITELAEVLAAAPPELDARQLCTLLVSELAEATAAEDDACLLVLRCVAPAP